MKVYITDGNHDVLLNGKLVQDVAWADEETGEACLYVHDANGERLSADQPDDARFVVCRGIVHVSKVDKNAASAQGPSPEYTPWASGCYPCLESKEPVFAGLIAKVSRDPKNGWMIDVTAQRVEPRWSGTKEELTQHLMRAGLKLAGRADWKIIPGTLEITKDDLNLLSKDK